MRERLTRIWCTLFHPWHTALWFNGYICNKCGRKYYNSKEIA